MIANRLFPPALLLAAASILLVACSDDSTGGATDARTDAAGDAGAAGDALPAATGRPAPIGVAIVNSDRMTTTVSLVALGGTAVATDTCIGSGSATAQLSAALSGDVALPSQTQPGNELVVIDRKNGVLTWVDPRVCQVRRQLNTGSGWASNPHDLVGGLPDGRGYVTRQGRNPARAEEGNDVLVIDTARAQVRSRIDLGPWATPGDSPGKPILPFPSRAVAIGDRVYVALNNLSEAYDAAGAGRVVVIDATRDTVVQAIDLPGLKNCGTVEAVHQADGSDALAVSCGGPYSDGPQQIDSAGVAWVNLATTPPQVTIVRASGFGRPVSGFDLVVLDAGAAFTVINGDGMMANDAVWGFDFTNPGGAPHKLFDSGSSYVLAIAGDPARGLLYVLDAAKNQPQVHVLKADGSKVASFPPSSSGLPPRALSLY
jgi:hypothetical protein